MSLADPFMTAERRAFRDSLPAFVERDITPFVDEWDETGKVPWELHQKAGALGMWGFGIEEDYGDLGFDDALYACQRWRIIMRLWLFQR